MRLGPKNETGANFLLIIKVINHEFPDVIVVARLNILVSSHKPLMGEKKIVMMVAWRQHPLDPVDPGITATAV